MCAICFSLRLIVVWLLQTQEMMMVPPGSAIRSYPTLNGQELSKLF